MVVPALVFQCENKTSQIGTCFFDSLMSCVRCVMTESGETKTSSETRATRCIGGDDPPPPTECWSPADRKTAFKTTYRPVFFDWGALLYTPIQPARAQNCAPIKNEPSVASAIIIAMHSRFLNSYQVEGLKTAMLSNLRDSFLHQSCAFCAIKSFSKSSTVKT